jgi:hypothetical protein
MRTEPIDGEALHCWLEAASHRRSSTWGDFTEAGGLPVAAGATAWLVQLTPAEPPALAWSPGNRPLNCLRLKPDDIGLRQPASPYLGPPRDERESEKLQKCSFSFCVADSHLKWRKMADPPS